MHAYVEESDSFDSCQYTVLSGPDRRQNLIDSGNFSLSFPGDPGPKPDLFHQQLPQHLTDWEPSVPLKGRAD